MRLEVGHLRVAVDDLLADREEMQFALALAGRAFEMTVERLLELGPDADNPPEKVARDVSQVRVLAEMCGRLAGSEAMAKARKAVNA